MTIDIERARAFVEANGTAIERARLRALLDDNVPDAVPDDLRDLQNSDGGFPVDLVGGRPSALSPTAHVLSWFRDLNLVDTDEAQRALTFIIDRQTPRGIWREASEVMQYNPPPWMDPESTAGDIYTTAICASTVVLLSDDELPADLAVNWLQTQQGRDGLLSGFKAHSSWLAVPAFEAIFGQETRGTRRLIAGLGMILADDWTGSMLAGMLQSLLDANYTRRTEVVNRAWYLLQEAQQDDGSFTTDEGENPVHTTLQALDIARRM